MLSFVIATGNDHKAEEFDRMFAACRLPIKAISAKTLGGMPKVVEDSGTFEGNAMLKASALRGIAGPEHWVMSDDSGLVCEALNGAPGVDTAIYAGEHATAAEHRAKLLRTLAGLAHERRSAYFICHLVVLGPSGERHEFTGRCHGHISEKESGYGGFGYDPIFIPAGYTDTFADLDPSIKDRISHRGRAFALLAAEFGKMNRLG